MKNKLYQWLSKILNDSYVVIHIGGTNCFNFIDHSVSNSHEDMWTILQLIDKEIFNEENLNFDEEEGCFVSYNKDHTVKCAVVPFDNDIYHTHLIGGNNGQH